MSTIKSSAENLTLNADGANNDIKFQSNGSEVASIDQAGLVTASGIASTTAASTNIVAKSTNGNGGYYNFQGLASDNTQTFGVNHNGTIYTTSGLAVGGTGAANTLDDYEEGTWTPAWNTGSNGRNISGTGGYTKVGNLVTVYGFFEIGGSNNTGSGDVSFSGLPFTSANVSAQRSAICIHVNKCASAVDGYISGFVYHNSQNFYVREGGIVADGSDLGNHFDQDTDFYISASYRV